VLPRPGDRRERQLSREDAQLVAAVQVIVYAGAIVVNAADGAVIFGAGTGERSAAEQARAAAILRALLRETALFRHRWAAAPLALIEDDLTT